MRVLVTGGAGFIGSAMVRYLVQAIGANVLTVDKLTYAGSLRSLSTVMGASNHQFSRTDVRNKSGILEIFENFKPNYVMHLAAESHVDRSIDASDSFITTNIFGTHVMLEVARHYWQRLAPDESARFRFIHVSTDEVYGTGGDGVFFTEDTGYAPSSPYAASKAAADHIALAWCRTYGLPVIVSNCSNNYGPFQFPEKLIPLMILNALDGLDLPIYGDGSNVRDWLHVEDHVRALWSIAMRGRAGQRYNIGANNEYSNLDIVRQICRLLDDLRPKATKYADHIRFVADRPGHDLRYAIDARKIRSELQWSAEEDFTAGLYKTILWYLNNSWWWGPIRKETYDGRRLGLDTSE